MRLAVIGAGPIGLEAALAAREHGHQITVYEQAVTVAGHVRRWGHVRMFTPWEMNVTPRMVAALGDRAPIGRVCRRARSSRQLCSNRSRRRQRSR